MNNYEYIVAGLPDITPDWKFPEGVTPETIIAEIREQLSKKDNALVDKLLDGSVDEKLTPEFYLDAAGSRDKFIREYFAFDLNLRNAKVRWLNASLGRPEGQDVMVVSEEEPEFPEQDAVAAALAAPDLIARERAMDDVRWDKISAITVFDWFNADTVLGFIAKLGIIARWFKLDEQQGRVMFRKLVDEVRGTFKGVNYKAE